MQKEKENQQHLFGEIDFVLNTLETERTEINAEIERTQKKIEQNEKKLEGLEERKGNISKAIMTEKELLEGKKQKKGRKR